jgi:group I intron endonuclease
MILNLINNKVYIGQTIQSPFSRWYQHKTKLRANKHQNIYLQNAYNKYGENSFEFIIIDTKVEENLSDDYERALIQWFKDLNISYNIDSGGCKGKRLSEETKRKLSEWNKNNPNPLNPIGKGLSPTLEHRNKLSKLKKGIKISEEIKNKIKNTKNSPEYMTNELRKKLSEASKKRTYFWNKGLIGVYKHSNDIKNKISESSSKEFSLISPDGEIFKGKNILAFSKRYNLNARSLCRVVSGERSHHKGWKKHLE